MSYPVMHTCICIIRRCCVYARGCADVVSTPHNWLASIPWRYLQSCFSVIGANEGSFLSPLLKKHYSILHMQSKKSLYKLNVHRSTSETADTKGSNHSTSSAGITACCRRDFWSCGQPLHKLLEGTDHSWVQGTPYGVVFRSNSKYDKNSNKVFKLVNRMTITSWAVYCGHHVCHHYTYHFIMQMSVVVLVGWG